MGHNCLSDKNNREVQHRNEQHMEHVHHREVLRVHRLLRNEKVNEASSFKWKIINGRTVHMALDGVQEWFENHRLQIRGEKKKCIDNGSHL